MIDAEEIKKRMQKFHPKTVELVKNEARLFCQYLMEFGDDRLVIQEGLYNSFERLFCRIDKQIREEEKRESDK